MVPIILKMQRGKSLSFLVRPMEEIAKSYHAKEVEGELYSFWEKNQFFKPRPSPSGRRFTMVIPPPNVTGLLHMGHALANTLQDIMVRWKRMSDMEVLWAPGSDHAGIATQTVVERELIKKTGKRRTDFTREEFLAHVWTWKEKSEQEIINQLKKLGCSCDWSCWAFTMDERRSKAVKTVFKKMFDDGLIYRGNYLVNWDPVAETALADDEVEYEEREGFLYYIKYYIVDSNKYLIVATTRPETLLGDTAVAVSPCDPRYQEYIGGSVIVPLVNRIVPIIGDALVDPTFGTGVVKVTPAHDFNDYTMAERHHLTLINIMTSKGYINEAGGLFEGLSMEEARKAVVKQLRQSGLFDKKEPYTRRVGVSYRSKAVIEPYLSKQWFIRLSSFKKKLIDRVQLKEVRFIPDSFKATYFHWIDHLRDWCVSRQLWWGHRIPIWYRVDDPSEMICYAGEALPPEVVENPNDWVQENDVLDTWFSSALWPFALFGWPDPGFEKFYPTSVLITGHDILFFWVARMMMMGEYLFQTPPFSEVFLHGLIFGKSYWRRREDGSISYLSSEERAQYELGGGPRGHR